MTRFADRVAAAEQTRRRRQDGISEGVDDDVTAVEPAAWWRERLCGIIGCRSWLGRWSVGWRVCRLLFPLEHE